MSNASISSNITLVYSFIFLQIFNRTGFPYRVALMTILYNDVNWKRSVNVIRPVGYARLLDQQC